MDKPAVMDAFERVRYGTEEIDDLGHPQLPRQTANVILQCHALDEFHDDIGGVVLLEKVEDAHDSGNVVEFCERLCLADALLPPDLKRFTEILLCQTVDAQTLLRIAPDRAAGKILLDRNFAQQDKIVSGVRDAEAALAHGFADRVPSVQDRLRRQMMRLRRISVVIKPAFRADAAGFERRETLQTIRNHTISRLVSVIRSILPENVPFRNTVLQNILCFSGKSATIFCGFSDKRRI